jgi:transcription elongation GreA/GreB family factor
MDKSKILEVLKTKLAEKIQKFEKLIESTRASNNDTKSSMGDKYETGREMLQQEINNLQRQLNEAMNQQTVLQKINTDPCTKVQNGALVKTDRGLFYISVSVGEIIYDNQKIMTVSAESPLSKAMYGLSKDQSFSLNNTSQSIKDLW